MSDDIHAVDLTAFQRDILAALAEDPNYGLGIKDELEEYYGEEVLHGRLYPNLDELVELGLVAKSRADKRTNEYELTDAGERVLDDHVEWLHVKLGIEIDDDHRLAGAKPATPSSDPRTDGGEGEDDDDDRTLGEEMAEAAEKAGLFEDDGGDA